MKNFKVHFIIVVIATFLSILFVHLKFDDSNKIYDARFKFNLQFHNDLYGNNRVLYHQEIQNFLIKNKLKIRFIDNLEYFQMKGTEKEILDTLSKVKIEMNKVNKKNYILSQEVYVNREKILKNLITLRMENADKFFYSDIAKWLQSALENFLFENVNSIKEYYTLNERYIKNFSKKDVSFFPKSKNKSEMINIILTIGTMLALLLITFHKKKIR